ncbi:MAG: hypothetical protein GXC78_18330 [Chitinophagaceae bacterium]|nr:hypothetical protein [Chitinophagaceae bacterium]
MPTTSSVGVDKLNLDLKNFRTTPQKKESDAIKAMIAIKPDRFFAVMDSILDDGYLPTENIIVLKSGTENIVKEGNRRIAILKIIHGLHKAKDYGLPHSILDKIAKLDATWKAENFNVPCTIFKSSEADKVDRVISLAHGKGEKASRDPWNSVARARHNRDMHGAAEPGLDLLEKYLKVGQNLTGQQKDRWGGEYNVTVLTEAMQKLYSKMGFKSTIELATKYPKVPHLVPFEDIIRDIGLEELETRHLRVKDFDVKYGFPPNQTSSGSSGGQGTTGTQGSTNTSSGSGGGQGSSSSSNAGTGGRGGSSTGPSSSSGSTGGTGGSTGSTGTSSGTTGSKAYAINDEKQVNQILKSFAPKGSNRQKVVTLRDELKSLKIKDNPIAFCLVLRSIFEVSAKIYAAEKSIPLQKSNGKDKTLAELLSGIYNQLTGNSSNTGMTKVLHGAHVEITKPSGILSITSMNQLVHSTTFSIIPADICTMFGNVYPLLEAMN